MRIITFKNSQESFIEALTTEGISYSRNINFSTAPMAAGITLEVMQAVGSAAPWAALAGAAVKWLSVKHGREIQITTRDGKVISGKNLTKEEFEKILEHADWLATIDHKSESKV